MLKTLVWKESRELLPFVVLALVVQSMLLLGAMQLRDVAYIGNGNGIPFADGSTVNSLFYVTGFAALGLGLWQTWWELSRGTFLFLLHRPLPRKTVFGVKLAVGGVACLLVCGLPLVIYALWAASPGTHASPFFWSMTTGAWLIWARMPLMYLGAFLSGLRSARWWGSRLLPVATGVFGVMFLILLEPWPLVSLAVTALFILVFLVAIFRIATTRDYS